MRILLHADVDLSLPGGLETHVRELARALGGRGHEVEIFGRPESLAGFRMNRSLEPARFDVVHLHDLGAPAALAAHPARVRTFHFCTAAKMSVYVRLGRIQTLANRANWRAVAVERAAARSRDSRILVSKRLRDEFVRWHGLDPTRATVISNGAGFDPPVQDRDTLRREAGISPESRVLITIGRADFVKGFDLLARARRSSPAASAGMTWVTVGGAAPSRSPGRVITGPLDPQQVIDWIHAADLGAMPSYYEGGGIALLEMLAGGLYTLAHDVGIAAEVIRPGVNGVIVERSVDAWRAALSAAASRPPARVRPGLPDEFRWSAIAERTERVYEAALARSAR